MHRVVSREEAGADGRTVEAIWRFIRKGTPIRWSGTLEELHAANKRNASLYRFSLNHLIDEADIVRAYESRVT